MSDISTINKDIQLYRRIKLSKKRPKLRKLFEMVGLNPNPFQQEVIKWVDEKSNEWHTLVFACARRSGKSEAAGLASVIELIIPNSSVALVAPSNKQTQIIFDNVLKFIRKLNLPIEKLDTNGKFIRLENGSTFRSVSEQTVHTLEGISISLLLVDELFLIPSIRKILSSLSPALSTYGVYEDTKMPVAKIIMLGSVKNNLEAKYYYDKGMRKEDGYVTLKFTAYENPLISKEFLEAEKSKLGEDIFAQEYLCEFRFLESSLVFKNFSIDKNVKNLSYIKSLTDNNTENIFGLDIGATDNTTFLIVYYENGKYYVIDGFEINDSSERSIAEHIKQKLNEYNIELNEYAFIDPAAKLTRIGLSIDYDLVFYPAMNAIKESVTLLNDLFRQEKLFIDSNLGFLIKQIQELEWKDTNNKGGDPFKRTKGHHFDAIASLRYAIYSHYKLTTNNEIIVL